MQIVKQCKVVHNAGVSAITKTKALNSDLDTFASAVLEQAQKINHQVSLAVLRTQPNLEELAEQFGGLTLPMLNTQDIADDSNNASDANAMVVADGESLMGTVTNAVLSTTTSSATSATAAKSMTKTLDGKPVQLSDGINKEIKSLSKDANHWTSAIQAVALIPTVDMATLREQLAGCMIDTSELMDPLGTCLLYTSPSPRDQRGSRMPSSA